MLDFTTPTGKVRLLIPDRKEGKLRYDDADIAVFLELEDGNVKRAAALAIETIASDVAATLLYIETNAIKVDGAKPSKALMDRAKELRSQTAVATEEEAEEDEWEFVFGCE